MAKEIRWIGEEEKILHWRVDGVSWNPYTTHPDRKPDHSFPLSNGVHSKGFTTAQELLKQGYKYA